MPDGGFVMEKRMITKKQLKAFRGYLQAEKREQSTAEKYLRDVRGFMLWLTDGAVSKNM